MSAYHRPETLRTACDLLKDNPHLKIVAGATDVYPAKAARAGWGNVLAQNILDISAIDFGARWTTTTTGWSLNPLTTWSNVSTAKLPPIFDGLKAAALQIGGAQVQNRGTVIGNICNASPAADGVPPLLALDAEIELTSHRGVRYMRLAEFIMGSRKTAIQPGEIATALNIPKQAGCSVFLKLGAREHLIISIAMVAAALECDTKGCVRSAKIAVGACSAVAQRLPLLEAALIGNLPRPNLVKPEYLAGLVPIDDIRASADYRRHAAWTLTRDAIAELASKEAAHG
jgi:xanthine dehydrogenase small subunit